MNEVSVEESRLGDEQLTFRHDHSLTPYPHIAYRLTVSLNGNRDCTRPLHLHTLIQADARLAGRVRHGTAMAQTRC